MKIAYVLFDGITWLDFIGVYDPLSRLRSQQHLPELSWDLCATAETVRDSFGLSIPIDRVRPDLGDYDLVIVPGGLGTRALRHDADFVNWLRTAGPVPLKASVCTGALLLGAAGFLRGIRATTHFGEYANLAEYAGEVTEQTVVDAGRVVTAGAVASSLDLGLHLCRRLAGPAASEQIARSMAYRRE